MTTVPPPPSKRQKTEAAERSRLQQETNEIPTNLGSVRIQFFDASTGTAAGAPVLVPVADATVKNLELLVNSLQGHDPTERVPYRFALRRDEGADEDSGQTDIAASLYQSVLKPGLKGTEDSINLQFTPQAVFRVKAVSRCASSMAGHGEAILAAHFSPRSSSRMVTGSGDCTARVWDCETSTPLHTLKGHTSWVLVVSYSPDDAMIATGSNDCTVRLWDPQTGQQLGATLKGHTRFVRSIAWEPYHLQAPGRPRLASASKDATLRVWNAGAKRIETVLSGHGASVSCVRWGGAGWLYSSSQDKTIKIWNPDAGTLITTLAAHAHWVNHLALSTDHVLRTAYHDHTGIIPPTPEAKRSHARQRYDAASTSNSAGGSPSERLVSASDDCTIYLWDPSSFGSTGASAASSSTIRPLARLLGHQRQVNHVSFSPDGSLIASAGFDGAVRLWDGHTGAFLRALRGHVAAVYEARFSADSRLLVSASRDTTLKVWDCASGKLREDLPGHRDEVFAVDWAPDGEKVGSGGKDRAVKLWRH